MKKFTVSPKQRVTAAEETTADDKLQAAIDVTDDNFSFVIDGINKISADGYPADAQMILDTLDDAINSAIAQVSAILASGAEAPAEEE